MAVIRLDSTPFQRLPDVSRDELMCLIFREFEYRARLRRDQEVAGSHPVTPA